MTDLTGATWSRDWEFFGLSLADLARARDLYHLQLLEHPSVVATALGLYLIRVDEAWPEGHQQAWAFVSSRPEADGPRRLDNSEVRPYSWPCILVFVSEWLDPRNQEGGERTDTLPAQVWLPDGRGVPLCVVEATPVEDRRELLTGLEFSRGFVGSGFPVVTDVQGEERVGTIGPLVTDGPRTYAMTNRHALGEPGSPVYTVMNGQRVRIGSCSELGLTRIPITDVYPDMPATNAFLNVDIGLVEIDDIHSWSAAAYGIGPIGPVADSRSRYLSLALIGQAVVGRGVATGETHGRIKGLLFRYKSIGGFEYLTDYLIGSGDPGEPFRTRPGDSGTVWYVPPVGSDGDALPRPLAVQWGGEVFRAGSRGGAPYALASSLATVCQHLNLDVIRDWNATLFRYWGAVGHYGIALCAVNLLGDTKLGRLMRNNRDNITFPEELISQETFHGITQRFVPLADVPDLVWKSGPAGRGPRGSNPENPNHYADMDAPDTAGQTLFEVSEDPAKGLKPAAWLEYYADPAVGRAKYQSGLLPFRVWQLYNDMVAFALSRDVERFVCIAGVLAHYVGDACQPLHASEYADGDPTATEPRTVRHRDGTEETRQVARGSGVHSAYEDDMVNRHVADIFTGLDAAVLHADAEIGSGRDAALATVALMKQAITTLPPPSIVERYIEIRDRAASERADMLWETFGDQTIQTMGAGVELLASLWRAAWNAGGGEDAEMPEDAISQARIHDIVVDPAFASSHTLDEIAAILAID